MIVGLLFSAAGTAAPPAQGAPPAQPPAKGAAPPAEDSLFEFLGSDDVGDARWWEYLRKSAPGSQPPPAQQAPAQEAGK